MAVHKEVLEAAWRLCRDRRAKTFRVADIVHALPHLNPSSVRTHVVSRCCVNAPKNHPHKWAYFRRIDRGEYAILAPTNDPLARPKRVAENPAPFAAPYALSGTIHVLVRRSAGAYVAEGLELALVTQGRSLDEVLRNLKQAVRLHLEGEDPAAFGLTDSLRIALTYEEGLASDAEA